MLSVMINRAPSGVNTRYKLKAEDITKSRRRRPTTAPLPGGTVLQIDMGISVYVVSVAGVCDDSSTETDTDAITIADRIDLEGVDSWYDDTIRLYTKWTGVIGTSNYVEGKVQNLEIKRFAFREYWTFRLDFAAESVTINS